MPGIETEIFRQIIAIFPSTIYFSASIVLFMLYYANERLNKKRDALFCFSKLLNQAVLPSIFLSSIVFLIALSVGAIFRLILATPDSFIGIFDYQDNSYGFIFIIIVFTLPTILSKFKYLHLIEKVESNCQI
jgi:hypothetical protein